MSANKILVFKKETTEYGVDVLIPVKVPEEINIDDVGEWLPTLHKHAHHHYIVMIVSDVREYEVKERPKVLYAESVDAAAPPKYDFEDYI